MVEMYQGYETVQYDVFIYPYVRPFFYSNGTQPVPLGNGTRPDIPLTCPTSTCNWPVYETLGVCSECADVSDLLNFDCRSTQIDWSTSHTGRVTPEAFPNGTVCGYFFDAGDYGSVLMSGYIVNNTSGSQTPGEALLVRMLPFTQISRNPILNGSVKFKHLRDSILDTLIVSSPDAESVYQHQRPIAQECVLSWCVKEIESSYESGQYTETVRKTYQNTTQCPFPWMSYEILPPIDNATSWWVEYARNISISRPPLMEFDDPSVFNDAYEVDNITMSNVITTFDNIFPSYFTDNGPWGKPTLRYKDFYIGASFRNLNFNPWQAPNNVTRHLERLATAVTNSMRSSTSVEMLEGAAYSKETYVSIKWGWLSFPILLLVLSSVFLVATIIKTSGDGATGLWKTSAMPTLIYSLPKETQSQFNSSSTWGSGKGAPRKTRIKLLPNLGWRVSGQSHLSRSPRLPTGERVPRGWI